jgi:RNA polymerase sigma-70 factor, ECF subfamily
MSTVEITPRHELDPVVAAATAGDEYAFSELVNRYGRELRVHCYRMLGSCEDSEDLTQETFLRAWHSRESFRGRSFRAWLYRIATNACLTTLERRARRRETVPRKGAASIWPSHPLLENIATKDPGPEDEVVSKEATELVFRVAGRHLPPRQRAVVFLRAVLGWSARDTAHLLGTSPASVNSALQRARATLRSEFAQVPPRGLPGASIARETASPEQLTARGCSRCPRSVLARPAVYPFKERTEPEGDPHETLHAEARLR